MATRRSSFDVLLRLAEQARRERAAALQQARSKLAEQLQQVEQLRAIADEYGDRSGSAPASQIGSKGRFRLQLWGLLAQQQSQVRTLEAEAAAALERYQVAHRSKLSYQRLIERAERTRSDRHRRFERRQVSPGSSSMLKSEE